MASKAGIVVRGGREFRSTLKAAGSDLSSMKEAHGKVARIVENASKQAAPKRTRRMANTIRGAGTKTAAIIRAGFKSVPYPGPIHWGWPAHHIKAQPFMSDAAQRTEGVWLPVYIQELDHALDQVKGI